MGAARAAVEAQARAALREHDYVEIVSDVPSRTRKGVRGTIVSAAPEFDRYTVEVVDADGRTTDFVTASGRHLALLERASADPPAG